MYRCKKCRETFENPLTVHDKVPYGSAYVDGPGYDICPYCKGDIEEDEEI